MSYVTPWFQGGTWDVCYLGNQGNVPLALPGVATLHLKIRNKLVTATTQGTDVPPVVNKGREPKKFVLTLRLTSQNEWNAWQDAVNQLNLNAPGKEFTPYIISHPQATVYGIKFVVIEDVSVQQPDAQSQYVVTMNLVESGDAVASKNGPPAPPGAVKNFDPSGGLVISNSDLQAKKALIQNAYPNMDTSDIQKRINEQDAINKKAAAAGFNPNSNVGINQV